VAEQLVEELRHFITSDILFGRDDLVIGDDAPLFDEGLVDSVGLMRLVAYLEEHYRLAIGDEELMPENFGTIARLAAFVAQKRREGG